MPSDPRSAFESWIEVNLSKGQKKEVVRVFLYSNLVTMGSKE